MKKEFSKIGQYLYNIVLKCAPFFAKHKLVYYILIYTWGLPYSIIGLLVSFVLILTGHKPHWHYLTWYLCVLNGWGGVSLGSNFLIGHDCQSCSNHELGHTLQLVLFGPLFYFLVAIPSFIRYWYIEIKRKRYYKKGKTFRSNYDGIWFEGSATDAGNLVIESINKG